MTAVRRAERVAHVLLESPPTTVAARVPDGRAVVLEATGEAIWHRLPRHDEPPIEIAELVGLLADDAGVDAAAIDADVRRFLSELSRECLLDVVVPDVDGSPVRSAWEDA